MGFIFVFLLLSVKFVLEIPHNFKFMKKISKFYLSGLTMALIGNFFVTGIAQASFTDVPNGIAYYYAINWMARQNVIQGYPDGTFRPDQCVNRAEFLKMLTTTLLGPNGDFSQAQQVSFKDTDSSAWYSSYLNMAVSRKIIQGYPDGTFRPAQCVSRAEAIKMTVTMVFPLPLTPATASTLTPQFTDVYKDIDQTQWYAPYVNFAAARNILGDEHTQVTHNYQPAGKMSRAEVAEMLYRLAVIVNNDAIVYNLAVPDIFTVGQKTTWVFTSDTIQDQERYADLHTIAAQIEQYFATNGKYPDAAPGGSCLNASPNGETLSGNVPKDSSGKGVGGCSNSYMYCKLSSGFMLAAYMNRPQDANGVLSAFSNLSVCNGSGTFSGSTAPGTSSGPWVFWLQK